MKIERPALSGFRVLISFVIVLSCVTFPAYCKGGTITLLIQQTPKDGGEVTPLAGTYKYDQNSEVTLTAKPKEGYEFAYWLGDVSSQESISTVVHLDKPKIVIAVFQPIQNNLNISGNAGGGGGGNGLVNTPVTIGMSAGLSGGGGGKPQQQKVYVSSGEKPPVVPEPATGVLLAIGGLLTFSKRRKKTISLSRSESRTPLS